MGIKPLAEADRPAVRTCVLRLSPEDRALRFGWANSDALLNTVAEAMALDGSLGRFLDDELIGLAHPPPVSAEEAELGISIEPRAGLCGWGHTQLSASLESVHAIDNKGLTAHYSLANRPMVRLLLAMPRKAHRSGSDVFTRIDLDHGSIEAHA